MLSDLERFKALKDLVFQEQTWFWHRFTALAALNAALLVLVTSTALQTHTGSRICVALLGFLLSAVWWRIQSSSLWYVDRYKEEFHKQRQKIGIVFSDHPLHGNRDRSSTDVALWVPKIVSAIWAIVFILTVVPLLP